MYNTETKNQFIELRAEGLSLDAISGRLNIPRCTLGRWHHESIEQIQRLRSLQWHLLEEQIGHRLEDSLQRIAQRIRKCEDELDTRDPHYRKAVELVRIIRDSRREYLQLRALLLAPLQPTRGRAACLTSIDQPKRDKTRQTPDALDTTSQPTNDLQQPQPATSHSAEAVTLVTPDVRRGLTSQCTLDNPPPSSEEVAPAHTHNLNHNHNPDSSSTSPPLCVDPPDVQPLINTPLQRGEPAQGVSDTTVSAVYPQSSDTIHPNPPPVGVPPSGGPSTSAPPRVAESFDTIPANDASPALPLPAGEGHTGNLSPSVPKRHKPYWLYGHYYQNPEYPEHIARSLCARRGHSALNSQRK
jgi:hypothetical protein